MAIEAVIHNKDANRPQIHRLETIHSIRQGITVYPQEADEIHRLPGLGDHRLNIAKARSRNQIEPGPIWDAGV